MKQTCATLSLLLLMLVLIFPGCGSKAPVDDQLKGLKAYVDAEIKIEHLRKQKPADWKAVESQYKIASSVVREADKKYGLDYDNRIEVALNRCKANIDARVKQQIFAKGLQHVTVLKIRENLKALVVAGDPDIRLKYANRIEILFEGIRPTFMRRDEDFFKQAPVLEQTALKALAGLKKAGDVITAGRDLENVIKRTYALSMIFEIIEIERIKIAKPGECHVKRMEAQIFYRIIQEAVKKADANADRNILYLLGSGFDQMSAMILEEDLRVGLKGITIR